MNDFLSNIFSTIGGGVQNLNNYLTAPSNPYQLKIPIPSEQLVSRNLPTGVQSPVPQNQILQHPQGGSGLQNTMNQVGQWGQRASENLSQWGNLFNPQPIQRPIQRSVQTPQPTTQPTASPNAFQDFSTAPVPATHEAIIRQSAIKVGLNPNLLASLLFSEHGFSLTPGFNYNTDGSYDRGPAQINSAAHPEITDAQALDPNFAIPWAAKTLAGHIRNLGLKRGILAYNKGANGALQVQDPTTDPYYQKVVSGLTPYLKKRMGL